MWRGQRGRAAKRICCHALGVGNVMLLVFGDSTTTLSLAVVLAPFTIASALILAALLACWVLCFALGDSRERAELLVGVIGGLQPSSEGEKYREAMLAEIRAAPSRLVQAIGINLVQTAPRTILAAWARPEEPSEAGPTAQGLLKPNS